MSHPPARPPQPWNAFLTALDEQLAGRVDLYCLGGFVMTQFYGMSRQTSDIDFLEIEPSANAAPVCELAGEGSLLAKKYKVYLHQTALQTVPGDFRDRLTEMFPGCYAQLRLLALDPYDLALSKLERNIQRDRDDVKWLARSVPLDLDVLQKRYKSEMRPYLSNEARQDLTLKLWIDMLKET